jgi:NAD(P)-dependent dehydrogenase (short-subunit alcohol dehydrogenase family)
MTADRFAPLPDVHLRGAFHVPRPAWKVMRDQGYGRILNTCSAAGILGSPGMSNYGSAKTGLMGLTRVLAAEAGSENIKINADYTVPGGTADEMVELFAMIMAN